MLHHFGFFFFGGSRETKRSEFKVSWKGGEYLEFMGEGY